MYTSKHSDFGQQKAPKVLISGQFVYKFVYIFRKSLNIKVYCGERGIRTPGTSRYGSFQDYCNRPLYHLSFCQWAKLPSESVCKGNMFFSNGQTNRPGIFPRPWPKGRPPPGGVGAEWGGRGHSQHTTSSTLASVGAVGTLPTSWNGKQVPILYALASSGSRRS